MACLVQFQILNKMRYFSVFQFCTTFLATWRNLLLTLLTVGFRVRPKTLYHSIPLHIMCAHHRSQYEIYQKSSSRERNLYYSYPWILLLMLLKYRAESREPSFVQRRSPSKGTLVGCWRARRVTSQRVDWNSGNVRFSNFLNYLAFPNNCVKSTHGWQWKVEQYGGVGTTKVSVLPRRW